MRFTDILDNILKKIEQGSPPSDLKAYISTAHDQVESAEKEQAQIQEELTDLKRMYSELTEKYGALRVALAKGHLKPEQVKILVALTEGDELDTSEVAQIAGCSRKVAEMVLIELAVRPDDEDDLVLRCSMESWRITATGSRYLYDRGLLK